MKFFTFAGERNHRVFNYKPLYYDKDKEERQKRLAKNQVLEDEEYVPGSSLQGAFRNGNYQVRKSANKAQMIIGIIGLLLFVAIMFMMIKYFALLF